jgi:hypothetical protein
LGGRTTTAVNAAWTSRFDNGADSAVPFPIVSRAMASVVPCIQNTS